MDIRLRSRIQRNHRKRTGNQHILGLNLGAVFRRSFSHLQRDFHARPTCRVGDLAAELKIADLHQRVLDGDAVHGGGDGCYGVAGVPVSDNAG